jgi:acetyltransferase-like isoleucine patch superfamily enzyme
MRLKSLNQLRRVRLIVTGARRQWLVRVKGMVIDPSASLSLSSRILSAERGSIVIGAESLVAFKTLILTRCAKTGAALSTRIGRRCFIGGGAVILPGVSIGDESIVAAGAVVGADVPPRCIVAGNPARVIRRDISVGKFGRLAGADANLRRLWQP